MQVVLFECIWMAVRRCNRAIIVAEAVASKDVNDFSIVGSIPAKIIRK